MYRLTTSGFHLLAGMVYCRVLPLPSHDRWVTIMCEGRLIGITDPTVVALRAYVPTVPGSAWYIGQAFRASYGAFAMADQYRGAVVIIGLADYGLTARIAMAVDWPGVAPAPKYRSLLAHAGRLPIRQRIET